MNFMSNIGLSLPSFRALLPLLAKYSAENNESIYMHEFAILSKHLSTSDGLGSKGSASFRNELQRHIREKQHPSQCSDTVFKPEHSSVSLLSRAISSSFHLWRMIVQEYKILIAHSLTWVPVFHTLETAVNDCTKLKTVESLEPIIFPFTFTLRFFAFSYLSFLTA